ncbi:MAG: CHRD domain-containing protein [Gemmatirosa sp.]
MHRLRPLSAAALAAVLLAPAAARAQTQLSATITTTQETTLPTLTTAVGAPRPTSFGFATFTLNEARTQLTMSATIFNIDVTGSQTADVNDNLAAAHIHCCTALNPGANAGVRWGFFGAPDNDDNPSQLVVTPLVGAVGGLFTSIWDAPEGNGNETLLSSLPGILAGQSYINFHTTQNGGGEIRGAIAVVPEPSTYLLMATGMAGLGMVAWRRRKS